ncbi:MAG: hypothetical protein NWF04_00835 [Candidatus Bathyarchaeota archaeon]|nr:hypothetical protein [Candidatus Bathyarchaeota archaeon]
MIKEGTQVLAQFPVTNEFLSKEGNPLRGYMGADMVKGYMAQEPESTSFTNIQNLRPGMTKANLKAQVLEISKPKRVNTKFGNQISLAKAVITDETQEKVKLCLWGDQIDAVAPGDFVEIENARVSYFRGEKQLSLGKTGTLQKKNQDSELKTLVSENTK